MIMYSKEIHNQNYFDENDIERSGISKTPNVKLVGTFWYQTDRTCGSRDHSNQRSHVTSRCELMLS